MRGDWDNYGRPKIKKPSNWDEVIGQWKSGEITAVEAMRQMELKKSTFYKLQKEELQRVQSIQSIQK